jgi:hypothetical protein
VVEPILLNVVAETVVAEGSTASDVAALRLWISDTIQGIKNGDSGVLTGLFVGFMFVFAGIYLWRKV